MTTRRPLVIVAGNVRELPAGDSVPSDALPAGSTATVWQGSATLSPGQSLTVTHASDVLKKRLVMAFKTDTAAGSAVIPVMSSNTTPSGTASASQILGSTYDAWCAMDGQVSTFWSSLNPDPPHWLRYDAAGAVTVSSYTVARRMQSAGVVYGATYFPTAWKLQYSSDGAAWLDADARSAIDFGASTEALSFTLAAPITASKWRLYITANASGGAYSQVSRFELTGVSAATHKQVSAASYEVTLTDTTTVLTRTAAGSEAVTLNVLIA